MLYLYANIIEYTATLTCGKTFTYKQNVIFLLNIDFIFKLKIHIVSN